MGEFRSETSLHANLHGVFNSSIGLKYQGHESHLDYHEKHDLFDNQVSVISPDVISIYVGYDVEANKKCIRQCSNLEDFENDLDKFIKDFKILQEEIIAFAKDLNKKK